MITAEKIKAYLHSVGTEVRVYESLDSTNAEAKRYAATCAERHPVLFLARAQSAGRGRMGRQFLSRAGKGIYMSLLYFTDKPLCDAVSVTTAAAAVTAVAIEKVTGRDVGIKWVNDLYNEKGKVCGILAETLAVEGGHAVIVGIGINVGNCDFPEELRGIASDIGEICGEEPRLIASVVDGLLTHAADPTERGYMREYRARFLLADKEVTLFRNGEAVGGGRVVGVDDDGGLLLLPDGQDSVLSIHSGEVTVRTR